MCCISHWGPGNRFRFDMLICDEALSKARAEAYCKWYAETFEADSDDESSQFTPRVDTDTLAFRPSI